MKIQNYIGAILSYGALTQFMKWVLDSIKVQDYFTQTLSFFLANIFAILMILMIMVYVLQLRTSLIEKVLNQKGLIKDEEKMSFDFIKRVIGKKGYFDVDARLLIVIMILLMIWLLWKAGKLPF